MSTCSDVCALDDMECLTLRLYGVRMTFGSFNCPTNDWVICMYDCILIQKYTFDLGKKMYPWDDVCFKYDLNSKKIK